MQQASNSVQALKTPPILVDEAGYIEWKDDLKIWELYTDLDRKKRGPAVYLTLHGHARDCVRDLTPGEIGADTGLKTIVDKLDKTFLKDKDTQTFITFETFYSYRRSSGENITDFIVHFEYLRHKMEKQSINLPEGVLAFLLLKAANISTENEKLARATCASMTYDNMKACITKIFGDPSSENSESNIPSVKAEPVFKTEHEEAFHTNWRGGWQSRGRGRGGRSRGYGNSSNRPYNADANYGGSSKNFETQRSNPVGRDGKVMRCFKCGSSTHFSRYCPQSRDNKELQEINIVLLNSEPEMTTLVRESLGMGILDSACTRTVTGETWLNVYLDTLSDSDRASVKWSKADTKFRFGDGIEVKSVKEIEFPVIIGKKRVRIKANVVKNEIPLLLSKASMKRAKLVLNFNNDTAEILGQNVKLHITSSGHYCVPLCNTLLMDNVLNTNIVLHTEALQYMSNDKKMKKAIKLHKQFAHASKEKLCNLVRNSKAYNDKMFLNMIEKCCDSCEICMKLRRPPLRPVVGLPMANRFNDVVCMDLKEHIHNKSWILHIIDSATKYSAACLISSKQQDVIVRCIYLNWICHFGSPRKFLTDNGGEFSNERFREMSEKLNIESTTTAAESPFSNGIVERHNLILAEAMIKVIDDVQCSPDIALAWAVSAKNALGSHDGFSSNQLVFGRNTNTPSVLIDRPPALESATSSDLIRINMNAMHSARKRYVEAESSEKIRRALRLRVRPYADVVFVNGEKVYYRRKNYKGWKGPAVVLGQERQFVLIRHGGAFYRVHPCQLMKKNKNENDVEKKSVKNMQLPEKQQFVDEDFEKFEDNLSDSEDSENVNNEGGIETENVNRYDSTVPFNESLRDCSVKPSRNTYVKYKLNNDDWACAKILSKQPKQSGKYRDWLNVHVDGQDDPICVNWDHVSEWCELPYPEQALLLTKDQEMSQDVVDAKNVEVNNMIVNKVFDKVPYDNQITVSSRWIITEKFINGIRKIKARIVARGFEEDSSSLRTDSPTCNRESLRLCFVVASINSWKIQSIDISAAFLQGNPIEREIYLRPPPDICSKSEVWRLRRCIYGLNDAPRSWYERVKEVLLQLGGVVSAYDSAVYLWHNHGILCGMLVSHVDDFAFCGDKSFEKNVIGGLRKIFRISTHDYGSFKYVGLDVFQDDGGIKVSQDSYIESIMPINIDSSRKSMKNNSLTKEERDDLKRLSGQMLWVTSQTRPDLSFETCRMSNIGKDPKVNILNVANKALSKLKRDEVKLQFPSLGDYRKLSVIVYSDATYASLEDGSSQGGHIVFLKGCNDKVVPIKWKSTRLNRVTKSPLASEALSLAEASDVGFLIATQVQEIFCLPTLPKVICYTDSRSLVDTLVTTKVISDTRLKVDVARLREMVDKEEIIVEWVDGKHQIADALTKRGASTASIIKTLNSNFV